MTSAQRIRVSGVVQGVGFRPFVWRLAHELELAGWVRNDSRGVEISAEGRAADLAVLVERLRREAPPLARIDSLSAQPASPAGALDFTIAPSVSDQCATAIGPDTAPCTSCLTEMFDPGDRRWRHAFITCTHCGPRYTIAGSLPYDRSRTSMRDFALCADCAREYADPADRRFHAEPIACPRCGPTLRMLDAYGTPLAGDPVARAVELIGAGAIVAIKGVGGYHLACDARSPAAVAALRQRKDREAKPLAVMVANAASLARLATAGELARRLLQSPERPIVLMPKAPGADRELFGIAPGVGHLGVMLPAGPLQWLLLHEAAGRPAGTRWLEEPQSTIFVMTSANPGGEPLVTGDGEALARLAGIADAYLMHDRGIVVRCDDSVVIADHRPRAVRRARGYTPQAIRLPGATGCVLGVGAYLKNTVCVTRGEEAFVSQHVGDLDDAATCGFMEEAVAHLLEILEVEPEAIAHDLHPDFASTRLAAAMAAARGVPAIGVQHHHAHVAAVLAEHGRREPVLGVALDGVGLGTDGGAWGGELLSIAGAQMQRVGCLAPLPLPGGDRAAREPWRMAGAVLHRLGRGAEIRARFPGQAAAGQLGQLLERQVQCPPTSSMGRVFDAAAALLGIAQVSRYEAEAAMRLEALARRGKAAPVGGSWRLAEDGTLDLLPLLERLADWRGSPADGAAFFHGALARAVGEWTVAAALRSGLSTVALSGGCFLNGLLSAALEEYLAGEGLAVLAPLQLPANDGAISVGQAWVALSARGA
jgi:hydrogenase maturation protein HypF